MKKTLFILFIATFVITTSQSQETKDNEPAEKHMMKKHHHQEAFSSLNLTEDQKAKLKVLNEEHRKQMEELKKTDDITVKEWRSKMEAQRNDHQAQIKSVLTTEQQAQLKKEKAGKKNMHKHGRKGRTHGDRGQKMKTELGLSEKQSAQMESSHKAMIEKMKALREDKSLNDDAKKEKVKELRTKQKDELKLILTDEQFKKYEALRHQKTQRKKTSNEPRK